MFGANSNEHQAFFQSGWFIESLLTQTLIVHMIRTRKIPFLQSVAAAPVLALTTAIIIIGMLVPYTAHRREDRHGGVAGRVLRLARTDGADVLRADPVDEAGLHPSLRTLVVR